MCMPHKSTAWTSHSYIQHTGDDTKSIQPGACKIKSNQILTQVVLHPVLWHRIKAASSGCAISLQRHRDKPLMSLHLHLWPAHVGSESKNKSSELDDSGWGSGHSVMVCACPMCAARVVSESGTTWSPMCSMAVVSELGRTWSKSQPNGSGAVIRMESALAVGATRIYRSVRKPILTSNITHDCIQSLVSPCHYLLLSQLVLALCRLLHHPTLPLPPCGHCCSR